VRSIFQQKLTPEIFQKLEIVIAVNRATEKKKAELKPLLDFPKVKLIFNEQNLGYPRGVNEAVKNSSGEILVIVNPDIVFHDENSLQKLVEKIQKNEQIGILAPRQINDGSEETAQTVRAFPKLLLQIARRTWLRKIAGIREKVEFDEMSHLDLSREQRVDWIQSSFWVLRRKLWEDLGGLDERFFLFMSDPDFCWRVWERGLEVVYFPEVVVRADGLRCSAGGFLTFFRSWVLRQHLRDALKYHRKYRGRRNPRANFKF